MKHYILESRLEPQPIAIIGAETNGQMLPKVQLALVQHFDENVILIGGFEKNEKQMCLEGRAFVGGEEIPYTLTEAAVY